MDHRFSAIPRHPGLIILKNGLENVSKFTANDYRNIMKVIIFVIDGLYDGYNEGEISCDRLCNVFYTYLKMYIMLRKETFTDVDLEELEVNKLLKAVKNRYVLTSLTILCLLVVNKRILSRICSHIFRILIE